MSLKFNKYQHNLISEALRNYIKHLELIEYGDLNYIDSLRNFLGKLLRETDWSYLLWSSPIKGIAGKIKIIKSSTKEYPRNSKWLLSHNGTIRLSSFFRSRNINLINNLIKLHPKSESLYEIHLASGDFLKIEADSSASNVLKKLKNVIEDEAFNHRTVPYLIVIDSIEFFFENREQLDQTLSSNLIKIKKLLIEEYYAISPKYVKKQLMQPTESNKTERVRLEMGKESLFFLEELLYEYCDIIEKSPSDDYGPEKLSKARKLAEVFRAANR